MSSIPDPENRSWDGAEYASGTERLLGVAVHLRQRILRPGHATSSHRWDESAQRIRQISAGGPQTFHKTGERKNLSRMLQHIRDQRRRARSLTLEIKPELHRDRKVIRCAIADAPDRNHRHSG